MANSRKNPLHFNDRQIQKPQTKQEEADKQPTWLINHKNQATNTDKQPTWLVN